MLLLLPTIETCLTRLAGAGGKGEIGPRLFAGILGRVYNREAASLAALALAAERLGVEGMEMPELAVGEDEKGSLLAAVGVVLDGLSKEDLGRLVVRLLRDGGESVRTLAGSLLQGLDRPSGGFVQLFAGMAEDESGEVRTSCVRVLGELGGEAAIPALVRALGDGDRYVRQEAIGALKGMGAAAVPAIVAALADENGTLASHAALVRGEMGVAAAVPALAAALEKRTTGHNAARALGLIGAKAAVPALIGALDSGHQGVRRLGTPEARARLRRR